MINTVPVVKHLSKCSGGRAAIAKAVVAVLVDKRNLVFVRILPIVAILAVAGCGHSKAALIGNPG